MGWLFDQYSVHHGYSPGVVTGKPIPLQGSLGREAATGRGAVIAAREALAVAGQKIAGTRFAIQGFGNVGSFTARLLHDQGARVVAVSDVKGGVFRGDGLDVPALSAHAKATGSVVGFAGAAAISNDDLLLLDCDVLVPAALGHVLTEKNASEVRAKYVLEAANGPCTAEASEILERRGVTCLPDIWVNAGGVTVSYFEWTQNVQQFKWSEERVNAELERHMVEAHTALRATIAQHRCSMRTAAFILAVERVKAATDLRGLG
jgi:glutamate dehydrogenase (NAD(P)+)